MTDLFREAQDLQRQLDDEGWPNFFVGGLAVQIWGQPRLTNDLDLTIFTGLVDETEQVERLLTLFTARFKTPQAAMEFSRTSRMLLLSTENGTDIDMMFGGIADINTDYERSSIQSFTPEISLRVCSAETLICMKTIAFRGQDQVDVENVIVKQRHLDWDYIDEYLKNASQYKDLSENISWLSRTRSKYRNR